MDSDSGRLDWRDSGLGTRVRVALWLRDEVGEGRPFSKQQLRAAITGAEQVDRRMRDLRPAGWVIRTYRDKPSLRPDELFLEAIGHPVWDPEHRAAGLRQISARLRREVFERDGFMCRRCGVSAGEEYPDEPSSHARLTLGHLASHRAGGGMDSDNLLTECSRCNETVRHLTGSRLDQAQVWDRIENLGKAQRRQLLAWMVHGSRVRTDTEKVWGLYWQLPGTAREQLKRELYDLLQR